MENAEQKDNLQTRQRGIGRIREKRFAEAGTARRDTSPLYRFLHQAWGLSWASRLYAAATGLRSACLRNADPSNLLLFVVEGDDTGKGLAFQEFQACAAPGADVAHAVRVA